MMNYSTATTPLLDKEYSSLSLADKNCFLIKILSGILDSEEFNDQSGIARESFSDYEWEAKTDIDADDFNRLLKAGQNNEMSECDLDDFMELVSDSGQSHMYYLIRKGLHAIVTDKGE